MRVYLTILLMAILISSCLKNPVEPKDGTVARKFPQATDTLKIDGGRK